MWQKLCKREVNVEKHTYSGLVRTGTSSCARASRYHTNAIAVNDFTIATRKWAKLYKPQVRRSVTR